MLPFATNKKHNSSADSRGRNLVKIVAQCMDVHIGMCIPEKIPPLT